MHGISIGSLTDTKIFKSQEIPNTYKSQLLKSPGYSPNPEYTRRLVFSAYDIAPRVDGHPIQVT